jgi:hypothetical protein
MTRTGEPVLISDPVDAILSRHGVRGPWARLPSTGVANRIYATADVVLRVATDHPEAVPDARTESVAAPVAHAALIRTPRLLAFDDTRDLVDRPYSLWERFHGVSADRLPGCVPELWRAVGLELARLHDRVRACADPCGWLDQPEPGPEPQRFVHDDIHAGNVMCTPAGVFLGLIDWGDAGWGDPMCDFAYMPKDALSEALEAYRSVAPDLVDGDALGRLTRLRARREP